MNIKLAIEAAIRQTLVIENKQSVGLAVERIVEMLNSDKKVQECDTTEAKSISEPLATNNHAEAIECYVPVSVEDELPEYCGWYFCIDPNSYPKRHSPDVFRFGSNNQWTSYEGDGKHPSHWLKKTTLYSSPVGGGMIWRKAAKPEDRPERGKEVIVRSFVTGYVKKTQNMEHFDGWDIAMDKKFLWENTEWLDESASPIVKDDWISAEAEPLIIKEGKHWQATENGSKMFLAALQVHDNRDNSTSWWLRLCVIEDETGLCIVGDEENEPAGWEIEDIQYYKIVNNPS